MVMQQSMVNIEDLYKLKMLKFHFNLIYKASNILDCNSLKILYVSLFTHILTIAVRFGEIHTKQVYSVYLFYKKELLELLHTVTIQLIQMKYLFNEIFVLKLKEIIAYKSYLLTFKAFNNMLFFILNSLFVVKSGPYSIHIRNKE